MKRSRQSKLRRPSDYLTTGHVVKEGEGVITPALRNLGDYTAKELAELKL
jgi:hypothetical protein